jgi:Fibronectin type III domain
VTAPTALPYGMRDLKMTPYTDAGGSVLGSEVVDLPNMQTFSFNETEEFQELRGDDRVVAIRGSGAVVEWELEAGGYKIRVWEIMTGGTVVQTGIAPNRSWRLEKRSSDNRGYFLIEGQVISDSGGDLHAVVYRCRCNESIEGEFSDGEFFITNASGQGLPILDDVNDLLYSITINETATPISGTALTIPALQNPPTNLAAGSPTSTTVPLTWTAATNGTPAATDYKVQRRTAFTDWADVADANLTSRTTTGATVTGLTASTQYQFRVRAVTVTNGNSDWTAAVTATTTA